MKRIQCWSSPSRNWVWLIPLILVAVVVKIQVWTSCHFCVLLWTARYEHPVTCACCEQPGMNILSLLPVVVNSQLWTSCHFCLLLWTARYEHPVTSACCCEQPVMNILSLLPAVVNIPSSLSPQSPLTPFPTVPSPHQIPHSPLPSPNSPQSPPPHTKFPTVPSSPYQIPHSPLPSSPHQIPHSPLPSSPHQIPHSPLPSSPHQIPHSPLPSSPYQIPHSPLPLPNSPQSPPLTKFPQSPPLTKFPTVPSPHPFPHSSLSKVGLLQRVQIWLYEVWLLYGMQVVREWTSQINEAWLPPQVDQILFLFLCFSAGVPEDFLKSLERVSDATIHWFHLLSSPSLFSLLEHQKTVC